MKRKNKNILSIIVLIILCISTAVTGYLYINNSNSTQKMQNTSGMQEPPDMQNGNNENKPPEKPNDNSTANSSESDNNNSQNNYSSIEKSDDKTIIIQYIKLFLA